MATSLADETDTTLLPEILGFPPQLLIDDLVNIANQAVVDGMEALEAAIKDSWMPEKPEEEEQMETGLVSLETLLYSHVDKAFDAFEHWSLNNVFKVPGDLKIVMPHQKGLDLTIPAEVETELESEIHDLKRRIESHRRMQSKLRLAVKSSNARVARSAARLEQLRFLSNLAGNESVRDNVNALLERVRSLPAIPPSTVQPLDPTKRRWETTHSGYMDWVVKRTIERSAQPGEPDAVMEDITVETAAVGSKEDLEKLASSSSN